MAKEKATSTALATTSSVPDVITKIDARIKALKHIQDSVYLTPGKVTMAGGTKDIKEEKSVTELVKALSSLHFRAKAQEEAYGLLDIKSYPQVKVDGGTIEEWVKDIKLRIAIIDQKETLDKLQEYKKRTEELMDKEDRKAQLIKEMEEFFVED